MAHRFIPDHLINCFFQFRICAAAAHKPPQVLVLMGMELPLPAIRSQIASGIDILIHLGRLRDKSRKVLKIVEIAGMEQGEVMLHELFRYEESGEEARHVRGTLMRTGRLMHTEKCERAGMNPEKEGCRSRSFSSGGR